MNLCKCCNLPFESNSNSILCEFCKKNNNNIYRGNCMVCERYYITYQHCYFCKECFINPGNYQNSCYAMEDYAKQLNKNSMYDLSDEELKNVPPLTNIRWSEIIRSIFGI